MKRFSFLLLLFVVATVSQAQLLWKVSGKDLKQPSYIIGTYHLAPATFADSIPGLKEAMNTTSQVCGEIVMADMASPENLSKIQSAMLLPDGQTIDKLFTQEEMARINALLKSLMGVDMTNNIVAQQLGRFTPDAITTQLTLLMYMKNHAGFNPNNAIDTYFQTSALAANKVVMGFETVDFQIETLYKGKTIDRQKTLLLCLADNFDTYKNLADNIMKAYFSQNLKLLHEAIVFKMNNSCDNTPEEMEALIYKRNAEWVKKMPAIMGDKSTLFAVGAGHLSGDKGLIELLRKAGYNVESVK